MSVGSDILTTSLTLREIGDFRNGVNFSKDSKGNKVKLINVKDIFGDSPRIDFPSLDEVDIGEVRNLCSYQAEKDDLFFVRSSVKRDGIGLVRLADLTSQGAVHCGFVIRFRLASEHVDPKYLTYLLRSPTYRERIKNLSGGAAITNISQDALGQLIIKVPDIATQCRIASTLSAYDNLIKNNTRRIAILEEMAQCTYEEWFVHFRFPGHEQVKMVESELGLIPEGWKISSYMDLFDVRYGKTLPTKNLDPSGAFPVYGGGGIIGRYNEHIVAGPTCLITSRGNGSGTVWKTTERAFVTNNSFVVIPKGDFEGRSFAFAELFSMKAPIKSALGGAAQPQLTLDGLASVRVVSFGKDLAKSFDSIVLPIYELIINLHHKNSNLRFTRDLLLPKLISGELDVSIMPDPEEINVA